MSLRKNDSLTYKSSNSVKGMLTLKKKSAKCRVDIDILEGNKM